MQSFSPTFALQGGCAGGGFVEGPRALSAIHSVLRGDLSRAHLILRQHNILRHPKTQCTVIAPSPRPLSDLLQPRKKTERTEMNGTENRIEREKR